MNLVRLVFALLCVVGSLSATQVTELNLISPVTGKRFKAIGVPLSQSTTRSEGTLADMGSDDDGCRHSSNLAEYERYVIADPTCYFAALAVEWDDRSGRFAQPLSPDVKEWVLKTFDADFKADWAQNFSRTKELASAQGQLPPDRASYVLPQDAISLEKRFNLALACYGKRGARPAVLAKIALTGAWALRTRAQLPISDPRLAGGMEEVNNLVLRQVKNGEQFSLNKWYKVYHDIFYDRSLTPTGYLIAGQVLFGFEMRRGDVAGCTKIIDKLMSRFKANNDNSDGMEFYRGLTRTFKRGEESYRGFLDTASQNFRVAVAQEEFTRNKLPEVMLAIAECLRRAGRNDAAIDWYLGLALLPETQPNLRRDIRAEGKFPSASSPYMVQIGWIADGYLAALSAGRDAVPTKPVGPDAGLINAILYEGLGTLEYKNPNWKPASGATQQDAALVLDLIGKGVLMYHDRLGEWPEQLGDLWMQDILHDRNRVNRFCDPATGTPFVYKQPVGEIAPKTILVVGANPIQTAEGKRYPAYLANNVVVWTEEAPKSGDLWLR